MNVNAQNVVRKGTRCLLSPMITCSIKDGDTPIHAGSNKAIDISTEAERFVMLMKRGANLAIQNNVRIAACHLMLDYESVCLQ